MSAIASMPGHVTASARNSSMANGSLYRTGSRTGTGSGHKSGDYPWKRCTVDVEDEELISEVNGKLSFLLLLLLLQ